jgi:hypothetical protein
VSMLPVTCVDLPGWNLRRCEQLCMQVCEYAFAVFYVLKAFKV